MKLINDTNTTSTALTVRKKNSLTVIHNFTYTAMRISRKAIFAAFSLTLLNLVI